MAEPHQMAAVDARDLAESAPPQLASLQTRIAAVAMVTAVAALLSACAVFIFEQWRAERVGQLRSQTYLAAGVAERLGPALAARDLRAVQSELASLDAAPFIRSSALLDARGQILTQHQSTAPPPYAEPEGRVDGRLVSKTPVHGPEGASGVLVTTSTPRGLSEILPRYLAVSGGLFFAACGLALFLGRALAGRVTEPIARLGSAMRDVAESGEFHRPVQRLVDDELGRLTDTFNALLSRLSANDRALKRSMSDLVQARDAAETANVLKSQFLANMSHEIRTPLNGVLAMAQVLTLGKLAPQQREQVEVIRRSGELLLAVLNDVLDVSKIEAGKLELEVTDFDLGELLDGVRASFDPMAMGKKVDLDFIIEPEALGTRRGDPVRLRQILNNLVSNALKFTSAGTVCVKVCGEGEGGADGLHVKVHDSGIGIDSAAMPHLFKKFTQADSTTTRRFGGTGLGLAICHDLAQLMGGRVWAESDVGVGSTFHLSLPFARIGEAALASPAAVVPDDQGRLLRVLAAEDNGTNQLVLTTILGIFGADLEIVEDGEKAVEAWRAGDFDVVLMDIQMPVMDGVAATQAIRAEEAATGRIRTPILALSANAMAHQIKEYLEAGMDGHIAKPIELPKLHAALEYALAQSPAQQPTAVAA